LTNCRWWRWWSEVGWELATIPSK